MVCELGGGRPLRSSQFQVIVPRPRAKVVFVPSVRLLSASNQAQ